jgi:hypothetical protein
MWIPLFLFHSPQLHKQENAGVSSYSEYVVGILGSEYTGVNAWEVTYSSYYVEMNMWELLYGVNMWV